MAAHTSPTFGMASVSTATEYLMPSLPTYVPSPSTRAISPNWVCWVKADPISTSGLMPAVNTLKVFSAELLWAITTLLVYALLTVSTDQPRYAPILRNSNTPFRA